VHGLIGLEAFTWLHKVVCDLRLCHDGKNPSPERHPTRIKSPMQPIRQAGQTVYRPYLTLPAWPIQRPRNTAPTSFVKGTSLGPSGCSRASVRSPLCCGIIIATTPECEYQEKATNNSDIFTQNRVAPPDCPFFDSPWAAGAIETLLTPRLRGAISRPN